jgi:hypothetical protein
MDRPKSHQDDLPMPNVLILTHCDSQAKTLPNQFLSSAPWSTNLNEHNREFSSHAVPHQAAPIHSGKRRQLPMRAQGSASTICYAHFFFICPLLWQLGEAL